MAFLPTEADLPRSPPHPPTSTGWPKEGALFQKRVSAPNSICSPSRGFAFLTGAIQTHVQTEPSDLSGTSPCRASKMLAIENGKRQDTKNSHDRKSGTSRSNPRTSITTCVPPRDREKYHGTLLPYPRRTSLGGKKT